MKLSKQLKESIIWSLGVGLLFMIVYIAICFTLWNFYYKFFIIYLRFTIILVIITFFMLYFDRSRNQK